MSLTKIKDAFLSFLGFKGFKWRKHHFFIYLFMLPSLVIFAAFYLIPIITVITSSFTKWDGFNERVFNGLDNYIRLFQATSFQAGLKNLLLWALLAAVIHVGFGVIVAFVLYKQPRGWKFTRSVFMIPNVVSVAAWAMIMRFGFDDKMGIINRAVCLFNPDFSANWIVTSPYAFWLITFTWLFFAVIVTLVVLGDLYAIPEELHEAAKIDGASPLKTIFRLDLPLCRISIGTSVILSMTARIGTYEIIKLTTNGGPGQDTYSLAMLMVSKIQDYDAGYANAVGTVMIVIGVVMLVVINKLFKMNESVY